MNDDEKRFLEQIQKQNEDAHAETRRQFAEFAQAIEQRFDSTTAKIEQRFDTKTAEIEQRNEVFKAVLVNHDRRLRIIEGIVLPQKLS